MLFEELAELTGQRNAIDGRIVDIVAEIDRRRAVGQHRVPVGAGAGGVEDRGVTDATPRPSPPSRTGCRSSRACAEGMREGRLSLDQVGVIAERAADGSDEHYAELAAVATVTQLRTAIKLEPRPEPEPATRTATRSISKTGDEQSTTWRITLPTWRPRSSTPRCDSHRDALIAEWKRDHDDGQDRTDRPRRPSSRRRCPTPSTGS